LGKAVASDTISEYLNSWKVGAIGAGACLLVGFGAGRGCRPVPVATVATSQTKSAADSHQATSAASTTNQESTKKVTTRTRITEPNGAKVDQVKVEVDGVVTQNQVTAASTADLHLTSTLDSKTVSTPVRLDPGWRLSLSLEWDTKSFDLQPTLRAGVEHRISGPFWAYGEVSPPVLGQSLDVRLGVRLAFEW
jgi:hypothetical protein